MAATFPDAQNDSRPTYYPAFVPRTLEYPDLPAWGLLKQAADDFPDRVALCYYDETWTYRELWEDAGRAAALFKERGVRPGDRVGLLMPNVPEYVIALHGIWMAGGVAVALSPLMVAEEVADLLAATGCRHVVTLDLLAPLAMSGESPPEHTFLVTIRDQLPVWQQIGYVVARRTKTGHWRMTEDDHVHWFRTELEGRTPDPDPVSLPPEETPAYILPTGGTTGCPKAVVLSHRNLVANAWQQFHWTGKRRGLDTFLAVLPFFHSYGLSAVIMTGITMAGTLVLHHRFNTRVVLRLIEQHQPTIFHAVPAMLRAMNDRLRRTPSDVSSIRWCISGGASLPLEIGEEFAEHSGAVIVEGFGLSEASPVTHVGPLDGANRVGTIGLPLPDTEARIVDAETGTREMPPGEVGELIVRGPQVMMGYWDNPDETARVVRDGWLFTGDLAACDEQGFFRIVDRKKDLIITSGFNVYPADVEHVLRRHPDVLDAAVVGVPDPVRGEAVKALLVMRKGTTFDQTEFEQFCREHLSAHKRPHLFEVVQGDLPRNFLGKVLRRHLREAALPTPEKAAADVAV